MKGHLAKRLVHTFSMHYSCMLLSPTYTTYNCQFDILLGLQLIHTTTALT